MLKFGSRKGEVSSEHIGAKEHDYCARAASMRIAECGMWSGRGGKGAGTLDSSGVDSDFAVLFFDIARASARSDGVAGDEPDSRT